MIEGLTNDRRMERGHMVNNPRLSRYIGDKAFYKTLLSILLPVVLQNGLTNLVSLLDNIMVGSVGTEQMSGVSIVNQLIFVFNLCIFGGLAGAGIFTAQFFGKEDHEGVRYTFRFKLMLALLIFAVGLVIFNCFSQPLIGLYLHEGSESGDIAATARYGMDYMKVILWGLLPFAIQQVYAGTLRECGETVVPMKAGIVAIFVNLVFNYILIFGKFGAPAMGVRGAAAATVLSRYVELAIIMVWTHTHKDHAPFIRGAFRSLHVPLHLVRDIFKKGMPLLANEFLWSAGMATLTQSYSTRGLAVVASMNICSTISNLFNVVWLSMGTVTAIMVGQQLGASRFEKAKETVRRLAVVSIAGAVAIGVIMIAFSPLFPRIYNTTDEVRSIASKLLIIVALAGPINAYCHTCYFTLRSGGKTWITFLFDSAYLWVLSIPLARMLTGLTAWPILPIYACCTFIDVVKAGLGFFMVRSGMWIHNIVDSK